MASLLLGSGKSPNSPLATSDTTSVGKNRDAWLLKGKNGSTGSLNSIQEYFGRGWSDTYYCLVGIKVSASYLAFL